ncbi:MAG: hypothetical protein R3D71_02230 [Rickettsiales bacterium]
MQLTVHHKFQPLSAQDGGKQHRFSWHEWDASSKQYEFIAHAMYQSGNDEISVSNGTKTKRGEVLRLQFSEDGKCEPTNGVEIKVDDKNWKASDYQKLANDVLHELKTNGNTGEKLNDKQKAAALTQLASLYNLMATQYGDVFTKGIKKTSNNPDNNELKDSIDELITDRKLRTVSKYFQNIAESVLQGKEPEIASLTLPQEPERESIPKYLIHHGIIAENGKKAHPFIMYKRKEHFTIPPDPDPHSKDFPYNKIAEAMYISGELGEKIAVFPMDAKSPMNIDLSKGLKLRARLGEEAMRQPINRNTIQSLVDPVPVIQNAEEIKRGIEQGNVNQDQAISALIMLASLNRLVATRYNGEFGYHPDGKKMSPHFFDDDKSDKDAQAAISHAAKINQGKNNSFDVMLKGGHMYTRPILISDSKSLDNFIRDNKFEREADSYLAAAAGMMSGKSLEESTEAANIPKWTLDKHIGRNSKIAYR